MTAIWAESTKSGLFLKCERFQFTFSVFYTHQNKLPKELYAF